MSHISDAKITTTQRLIGVMARASGAAAPMRRQIAGLMLALGALLAQPVLAADNAYVIDTILVSTKVVSSTQTDYSYSVRVLNTGAALKGAVVHVTSDSSCCRVINNEALLGDLPRGTTTTSTDTVTIRRSRPGPPRPDDLEWTVHGTEVNSPPVANAGPDQTVRVGTRVTLDGTGSTDADGERLFYHWKFVSKPAGSAARLSSVTAGRPTFLVDKRGTYVFRLLVSDEADDFEEGDSHCRSAEVRISTINSAPVANAGLDRTVPRASTVTLDGTGSSDPDGDALTYAWSIVSAPAGSTATLSSSTSSRPNITLDKPGSYRFSLTVSDGTLSSRPAQVVITTQNSIPVANAGVDQSGRIGVLVTLDGTASSDADNDPLSFSWTWVSTPAGSGAILLNANTPRPSFMPDVAGLYVIQLIVNDGFADSVPRTTTVTIAVPVNRPPVANPDTATTPQDTPVVINVLANDTDPDVGDILTIASFTQPTSGGIVAQVPGGLQFTPTAGFVGIATFTYVVSDGQLTATGTVTVTVTPAVRNQPPSVNAGADQIATMSYSVPTVTISLAGTVTDDGLPAPPHLTIGWSKVSGPGNVIFSAGTAAATSASFDALGVYVLRLSASDGVLSSSADVRVTVQVPPNTGPTLSAISDRTQGVGSALSLLIRANDINPFDTLTFALGAAPAGAAMTPSGRLSWTPTPSQLGPQNITVSVHNAAGQSDSKSFLVTVVNQNLPPVLGALSNDTAAVGVGYSKTITASDPNGDALAFDLIAGPAGMTLTGSTLTWVPTAAQIGDAAVKVRARDPAGAAAVGFFKVTVVIAGAPIATDDSYAVKLGEVLNVAAPGVLGNDTDPYGGTLRAIKRSDPVVGTLSAFNADGSFTYQAPATNPKPPFAATGRILTTDADVWGGPKGLPVMGDLNRDGMPDLITVHDQGTAIVATSGGDGHRLWGVNPVCRIVLDYSTPTQLLADIDDDGRLEYVFSSDCPGDTDAWTRLQALADDGHTKWTSEPLTKPFYDFPCGTNGTCSTTSQRVEFAISRGVSLAVARLAANEAPTIMLRQYIGAQAAFIYTKLADGSYGYKYYGCRIATGLDADMGQECTVTMLISPLDGSVKQVLRSPVRNYTNPSGYLKPYVRNAPQAVDIDGDGEVEIVSGADVWKRVNGAWTLLWQAPFEPQQVAVVDLDGDGKPEIVYQVDHAGNGPSANDPIAGFSGFIIYDHTGVEQRRIPLPLYFSGMLTVADVDGDNLPELLMVQDGYLQVINADGSFKWTYTVPDHPVWTLPQGQRTSTLTNVQVYDLDGDGNKEVIFSSAGWLHILDGRTGAEKVRFDVGRRQDGYYAPAWTFVTDWNNDGHADILSVASGTGNISDPGSFVITAANNDWLPAGKYYGQADYRPSNIDDSGHVLFDPSVQRSSRNPKQLGTVRDPRVTAGTSFDYVANNGTADSPVAKVFLTIAPPNSPPVFTSRPPTAMQASGPSPFVYQPAAFDPDVGDTITYSVNSYASNGLQPYATIDANTGAVSMPRSGAYGAFTARITITATDSHGATAIQSFVISHVTAAPVAVPNVIGNTVLAATQALTAVSLQSSVLQEQFNAQAAGTVIAQSPLAATSQPLGTTVLLTVSKGPAPTVVPNLIGRFEAAAVAALGSAGFTTNITRQFSNIVDSGVVLDQSVAGGSKQAGGSVGLVVSAGSGLDLRLSRTVTPANVAIPFTLVAMDLNGHVVSSPAVTTTITSISGTSGVLPTVVGGAITPSADTRGRYRLTIADSSRASSAEFVVAQPNTAAAPTQLELFAQLDAALVAMDQLLADANAARLANDMPTMSAKAAAWVNTWRAVDIEALSLAVPVAPENGFPPDVADLAAFGVAQTPDDILNKTILRDAKDDLYAIEQALRNPITPYQQVRDLFRSFNDRAARIRSVSPGEYGVVDAKSLYAEVLAHRVPQVMDALVEDVARAFGLPARKPFFLRLVRSELPASGDAAAASPLMASTNASRPAGEVYVLSTLGEQLATTAVQQTVDAIGGGYTVRKFYQAAFVSAVGGAVIVAAAHHIKDLAPGTGDLSVTTGASISVNVFEAPYSTIEGLGLNGDAPAENTVMIIGPEVFDAFRDVIEKLKGLGGLVSKAAGVVKAKNLDESNKGLQDFRKKAKEQEGILLTAAQRIQRELANIYQTPSPRAEVTDCLFTTGPLCRSVQYADGFTSVYASLGLNLATPVLYVVVNNINGATLVGTPVFLPHPVPPAP